MKKRKEYCCVVQMHGSEHTRHFQWFRSDAVVFRLFKVFSLSLQHIRRTYRANIRNQVIENTTILSYIIHIKRCFLGTNQWLRFVCLSIFGGHFSALFQCVMTVSWNQPQPGCWNYLYYIFIHASTQHNISNKDSFQQYFIFNWNE